MPWAPGESGNPGGRPREVLEVREVRRLAQAKTKEAFEIVAALMTDADKDSVRLAAALAVLKLAGVRMDAELTTVNPLPAIPQLTKSASVEDLEAAASKGEA